TRRTSSSASIRCAREPCSCAASSTASALNGSSGSSILRCFSKGLLSSVSGAYLSPRFRKTFPFLLQFVDAGLRAFAQTLCCLREGVKDVKTITHCRACGSKALTPAFSMPLGPRKVFSLKQDETADYVL